MAPNGPSGHTHAHGKRVGKTSGVMCILNITYRLNPIANGTPSHPLYSYNMRQWSIPNWMIKKERERMHPIGGRYRSIDYHQWRFNFSLAYGCNIGRHKSHNVPIHKGQGLPPLTINTIYNDGHFHS